jgi:TorA maturation chaperone TorD
MDASPTIADLSTPRPRVMISADVLAARRYLYTLFQALFGEAPDPERLSRMDPELAHLAFGVLGCGPQRGFVEALEDAKSDPEATCRLYTREFVGPGKLPAYPWESVYASGDEALFTETTLEVRRAYRSQGLLPAQYPQVADDHIGLEMGFLAALADRACAAQEQGCEGALRIALAASRDFLVEHLSRWVGRWAGDLTRASGAGVYSLGASAANAFVERDLDLLGEWALQRGAI